ASHRGRTAPRRAWREGRDSEKKEQRLRRDSRSSNNNNRSRIPQRFRTSNLGLPARARGRGNKMSARDKTITGALEIIASKLGGLPPMPSAMQTDPREELIIRYTVGQGVVHSRPAENPTEVRITVTGKIYKLDGKEDGTWEGADDQVS